MVDIRVLFGIALSLGLINLVFGLWPRSESATGVRLASRPALALYVLSIGLSSAPFLLTIRTPWMGIALGSSAVAMGVITLVLLSSRHLKS